LKKLILPLFITIMFVFLFTLLSTVLRADTDVTQKFLQFAKSFCSGGDVTNADIGNGNIFYGEEYKDFEMSQSDREQYAADIEDRFGISVHNLEGLRSGGNDVEGCDEAHGNTCQHTAGQYTWCNYPQYKCMSKYASQIGQITYPTMDQKEGPPTIYTVYYDNGLEKATNFSLKKELSTSSQQLISVTDSLSIGESLKITGGEPAIMSAEVSFSVQFDMSQTRSWTETSTQTFTFQTSIPVEAGSTTMAKMTIAKASYKGTWEAQVDLPFYAKLWCSDKTNGHNEWFVPAHYFMGDGPYHGSGTFEGGAGYNSHVSAYKCPLNARTPAECNDQEMMPPAKRLVKASVA